MTEQGIVDTLNKQINYYKNKPGYAFTSYYTNKVAELLDKKMHLLKANPKLVDRRFSDG